MIRKENPPQLPATHSGTKPGDYPVGSAQSRAAARAMLVARLEQPTETLRVILSWIGTPLQMAKSTCRRTRTADGRVLEMVELHGSAADLKPEELEAFIATFPIENEVSNLSGY